MTMSASLIAENQYLDKVKDSGQKCIYTDNTLPKKSARFRIQAQKRYTILIISNQEFSICFIQAQNTYCTNNTQPSSLSSFT